MSARPWYKRYPGDFIAGTLRMTLEEKGAYSMVLDMIYDYGRPIPDDPQWIARVCGCSTRKWNQIRLRLLELEKLHAVDGVLTNDRAIKQLLSEDKEHDKLAENGAKGAEKTNEKKASSRNNNEIAEKGPTSSERPNQKPDTRTVPIGTADSRIADVDFERFWTAWQAYKTAKGPKGDAAVEWARHVRKAGLDPGMVTSQAVAYCEECQRTDTNTQNIFRWIRKHRWEDERIQFSENTRTRTADDRRREIIEGAQDAGKMVAGAYPAQRHNA